MAAERAGPGGCPKRVGGPGALKGGSGGARRAVCCTRHAPVALLLPGPVATATAAAPRCCGSTWLGGGLRLGLAPHGWGRRSRGPACRGAAPAAAAGTGGAALGAHRGGRGGARRGGKLKSPAGGFDVCHTKGRGVLGAGRGRPPSRRRPGGAAQLP